MKKQYLVEARFQGSEEWVNLSLKINSYRYQSSLNEVRQLLSYCLSTYDIAEYTVKVRSLTPWKVISGI